MQSADDVVKTASGGPAAKHENFGAFVDNSESSSDTDEEETRINSLITEKMHVSMAMGRRSFGTSSIATKLAPFGKAGEKRAR